MPDAGDYEPNPRYTPMGSHVLAGWEAAADLLPTDLGVLALEGPAILDWDAAVVGLTAALARRQVTVRHLDMRTHLAPWERIVERTTTDALRADPDFARLAHGSLADLFDQLPPVDAVAGETLIVSGPGAALVSHDVLWYVDLPKRYAEAAVAAGTGRNLGQPADAGPATTRRLFYIDWTILDRHRDALMPRVDRWIDLQDPSRPTSLDGESLRRTGADLAGRPFRTRPTFKTAPWGGHWGQRRLGQAPDAENTAIGYELIAPEAGVLLGDGADEQVEVPFQLLVAHRPEAILGPAVHGAFGTSFPIRFDYLDTVDGGNLSVHCHPQADYMHRVFGWTYPQHESYYMMVGGEDRLVFLGLREGVDLDAFHRVAQEAADDGRPFDIGEYVQTFPAEPHQLFMVPAGTPHASGEGNVVLEVSATPYLYSLRFYDWLRRDTAGRQRPVHVGHAFANLDPARRGDSVAQDLVQEPRSIRGGTGWREELLGALPEVFFEVRRIVLDGDRPASDDTDDRFHVLTVVEGEGVVVETAGDHRHELRYAETMVVPAAVGAYHLRRRGHGRTRVVKAHVKEA